MNGPPDTDGCPSGELREGARQLIGLRREIFSLYEAMHKPRRECFIGPHGPAGEEQFERPPLP